MNKLDVFRFRKENGLNIPVVYNSSGYENVESLKKLDGKINIYIPDLKYADDNLALMSPILGVYWLSVAFVLSHQFLALFQAADNFALISPILGTYSLNLAFVVSHQVLALLQAVDSFALISPMFGV